MMFRKQVIAGMISLVVALAALGQVPQRGLKGYELYSWQSDGKWHYSILTGTNRNKTYEEITSQKPVLVGDTALRAALRKLPRGEEVFWMSDGPHVVAKSGTDEVSGLKMPSRKRIKRLKAYCDKLGIKLKLV